MTCDAIVRESFPPRSDVCVRTLERITLCAVANE
jgi:hypothetical protein